MKRVCQLVQKNPADIFLDRDWTARCMMDGWTNGWGRWKNHDLEMAMGRNQDGQPRCDLVYRYLL